MSLPSDYSPPTPPTADESHVAEALAQLLGQYQDSTGIEALVTAFVSPLQVLEDAANELLLGRLDIADNEVVGEQLDLLATIVGTSRLGGTDAQLQAAIQTVISENASQCDPETIISLALSIALQQGVAATQVFIDEQGYAAVGIMYNAVLTTGEMNAIFPQIKAALGAGISVDYLGYYNPTNPFAFAGGTSIGGGFGDVNNPTVNGGKLASVYGNPTEPNDGPEGP